ncbi:trichohyalin isoform X2 [Homalodisca vitripennis]|uniref:trichohyalin isoform X2 n=1 Tax=Homalodisca vitripennis TaxID=197043 RepID=UPI001EEB3829|nr:trichohyalin isoform X2 [Homalodisca vitripennis]
MIFDGDGDGEEGETSGYASDSGERQEYQPSWPSKPRSRQNSTWHSSNCLNTPDSLNSDGGRPRWGDKGVGVGHLWDASIHNPDARLPAVTDRPGATPPAWLCRATNNTVSEVLVITHPEVSSPVTEYGSCDTLANSDRTYLRGQNISIEPEELMERERKRQKAKELQNAIRQQLEERERKRKEERERRQREERLEEERLRKQQEIERKRLDEERQKQREKEVKEERKEKAMREAIETAERLAREEKIKTRKKYKQEVSETHLPVYEERTDAPCVVSSELKIARVELEQPKLLHMQENQAEQQIKEEVDISKEQSAPTIMEQTSPKPPQNQEKEIKLSIKNDDISQQKEIVKPHIMNVKKENSTESSDDQDVDPDSLDEEVSPEIALVLSEPHEVEVNQLSLVVSPGRLLTPSKFRTNPSYEKSTQTDLIKSEKLPLRCRSQPRLEERPKWGVNRPETQYIKQSERDPYYQTRLRRNLMRVRSKSNKPEREDSRSPSPVNMKVQGNQAPVTTVSRGTITPRVMQMVLPSHNPLRASRPRYLSFKGGVGAVMASNVFRPKPEPRPQQPPAELSLVSDVLNQLTSLRKGLTMKQQEWDASRSQTPFSEVSSLSTSA